MAALVLSAVGAAAGGAIFGPVGAIAGRLVGAVAGNMVDRSLFASHTTREVEGPRLADLDVMASTEGAPVPRIYGRVRIAGQMIWATRFEEVVSTRSETIGGGGGGKGGGGGGGSGSVTTVTTTYSYFASFAVGLCEGTIGQVARVWADGKPLDLSGIVMRVYRGDEAQDADPLIVAKMDGGPGGVPAYRGLAYVVFERLPLARFGNRIPQLSFEVMRPLGRLEAMVRAVTLIPGATEFGYEPANVVRVMGPGRYAPENGHVAHAVSDIEASLDELQAVCPNVERVGIVVSWFGDDLRAGHCTLRPRVDSAVKQTTPLQWSVAGVTRETAGVVSQSGGRPAYGGTPSDASLTHLIAELKSRGLKITFNPFVMMDIAPGNALADPYSDAGTQPAYPWRGRITCHPAPGRPGSPDGTNDAAAQVAAFVGSETPDVDEWSLRRMVLHYARLCRDAGGVDAFLIGSEMRALTRVRSASGVYPFVNALAALAADVKAILGPSTIVTYGADWTEYGCHVVDAQAREVRFPLDALWASPAIDAVGIDYYAPLADWRDGEDHLDRAAAASIHDRGYLAGNLRGGEGYDWYYADDAARAAQARSEITDGLGKPWMLRVKDLWSWWSQPHVERVDGVELETPTPWTPQGKPIWLTECGCPAVDKGANQPSTFPDAKSSEGGLPYFSNGRRDDMMQRAALEAVLGALDPAFGAAEAMNPVSPVYGGRMFEVSGLHLWTWDARPYPVFPAARDVWGDGDNWETGHWLTGRLGGAPLGELVPAILADAGIADVAAEGLGESVEGYAIDRPMSPRAAIEPLARAYAFDAREEEGALVFRPRGGAAVAEIAEDDLVSAGDRAPARLTRAQETELPREVALGYTDIGNDYRRAAALSRRLVGGAQRTGGTDVAVVTHAAAATRRAEIWLQDLWAGRESADFALAPSALALAPGDVVGLTVSGRRRLYEIQSITEAEGREVKARSIDPGVFDAPAARPHYRPPALAEAVGPVAAVLLDLPALPGEEPPALQHAAVFAEPWPGGVAVWRAVDGESFSRVATAEAPSVIGELLDPLPRGRSAQWDRGARIRVRLHGGALVSATEAAVRAGANAAALRNADGGWEVIQYAAAELIAEDIYELSLLLRGQLGTEWAMGDPTPAGSVFVGIDRLLVPLTRSAEMIGRETTLRLVAAARSHGDASAVEIAASAAATALRPLAPVAVRARRGDSGIVIDWARRTRRDGDSWGPGDIPLGEEREAYEIDVIAGGVVRRTLSAAMPQALYAAEDELADFGAAQTQLTLAVVQLSIAAGRGHPAIVTLDV